MPAEPVLFSKTTSCLIGCNVVLGDGVRLLSGDETSFRLGLGSAVVCGDFYYPVNSYDLRARVKAALRRTAEDDAPTFRFGAAEVDFARCELRRGDTPVEELAEAHAGLLHETAQKLGVEPTREVGHA